MAGKEPATKLFLEQAVPPPAALISATLWKCRLHSNHMLLDQMTARLKDILRTLACDSRILQ